MVVSAACVAIFDKSLIDPAVPFNRLLLAKALDVPVARWRCRCR